MMRFKYKVSNKCHHIIDILDKLTNVRKYPTTVGKDFPRIAKIFEGCSTISPRESKTDPAVTVI